MILIFLNCNAFDEEYLSYIYIKNNTTCSLDIYLNSDFQFTIIKEDGIRIIENIHLGENQVSAYLSGTNELIHSLNISVFQHNRAYYFIISEDLCP